MERLISSLTSLGDVQTEFRTILCEIPDYVGRLPASLQVYIPEGSRGKVIHLPVQDLGEGIDLAINACSLWHPQKTLKKRGEAHYGLKVDGETFEVAIGDYDTVTIPYRPFQHLDIVVLSDEADVLILNDLRAVIDELPQDVLQGFMKMELPYYPIGQVSVQMGDRKVTLPDITNVVEGAVILIGDHRHQIKGLAGDVATLEDTQAGNHILEDYQGECYLVTPITIGYYDQDLKLPSVVIWFSSPTPDLRAIRREPYRVFGNSAYVKERTQFEKWTVRIEVVGGSPEMVQAVATYVRQFLEGNKVWVNGKRFTFEWTDSAVDTEPSTYLEIQPSVAYSIEITLQEEMLWQTIQMGSGKVRTVLPTLRRDALTLETLLPNQGNLRSVASGTDGMPVAQKVTP